MASAANSVSSSPRQVGRVISPTDEYRLPAAHDASSDVRRQPRKKPSALSASMAASSAYAGGRGAARSACMVVREQTSADRLHSCNSTTLQL